MKMVTGRTDRGTEGYTPCLELGSFPGSQAAQEKADLPNGCCHLAQLLLTTTPGLTYHRSWGERRAFFLEQGFG